MTWGSGKEAKLLKTNDFPRRWGILVEYACNSFVFNRLL